MDNNLYWSVYQNIEREVIDLSEKIHIDDNQLSVYSIKIAELLIRCVVEIESIVKELYLNNGGTKPRHDKDLYFDTDCIQHLENLWKLSKKHVLVVAPNFYFEKEENKVLTPFHKAFKRGSSSSDWQKAYQAVKHNRAKHLNKGNLKNLIRALSALYLANIYYNNYVFDLNNDSSGNTFNRSMGSFIFAIKLHCNADISISKPLIKDKNYVECTYILQASEESKLKARELIKEVNETKHKLKIQNILNFLNELSLVINNSSNMDDLVSEIDEITKRTQTNIKEGTNSVHRNIVPQFNKIVEALEYEAILNKHQFEPATIFLSYVPSS